MAVFLVSVYRMNIICIKILATLFVVIGRSWNSYEKQRIQNSQKNLDKEGHSWRIHSFQFQNLLQSHGQSVTKTVWHWRKDRHTDQQERNQSMEQTLTPVVSWFSVQCLRQFIMERKKKLFKKWCWDNWILTYRRMKLDPYTSHYIQKLTQTGPRPKCKS